MKEKEALTTYFQCINCQKKFKYLSEKQRHELSHRKDFECNVCYKKFSFLSALHRHQKQHQRTETIICKECNGRFKDEVLLKRHMTYAHSGSHTCTMCLSTFNSEAALKTHMKSHKSKEERKYKCSYEECDKSFNFSHHLKHHELTHTNSKQHFCSFCGKGFIQSHHLKRHLLSHDPECWMPCTIAGCEKKFATDYARKRHLAKHIKEIFVNADLNVTHEPTSKDPHISEDRKTDPLVCPGCGELVTKGKLKQHALKCLKPVQESMFESTVNVSNDTVKEKSYAVINNDLYADDGTDMCKNNDPATTVRDCNNAIGGCIVTGGKEVSENCLCAQIPLSPEAYYDNGFNLMNGNEVKTVQLQEDGACCGCSENKYKHDGAAVETVDGVEMPNIEYRLDGVIKIRDTFDIGALDTKVESDNLQVLNTDIVESMALSCKSILGNCIVSGDGTIGDGCLCARMSSNIQQASAQEIDEITICDRNE